MQSLVLQLFTCMKALQRIALLAHPDMHSDAHHHFSAGPAAQCRAFVVVLLSLLRTAAVWLCLIRVTAVLLYRSCVAAVLMHTTILLCLLRIAVILLCLAS